LGKCIQNVGEVIEFVGQAETEDFGNFLNLCGEKFWPFFDVSVILVLDDCWSKCKWRKVEGHPDLDKVGGCRVFYRRAEQ
jgi:hypothetical protein